MPLEARGLGVPLLSSAPRAPPEAAALRGGEDDFSAPLSPRELEISEVEISDGARPPLSGGEGGEGADGQRAVLRGREEGEEDAAPYLRVEPAAAAAASAREGGAAPTPTLRAHPRSGGRHRRSTSDPQLNLDFVKDELDLPPGSGALLASNPSAHHGRTGSGLLARDNQLAARGGGADLGERSAPSPRRRLAPMHDVSLERQSSDPLHYSFEEVRVRV